MGAHDTAGHLGSPAQKCSEFSCPESSSLNNATAVVGFPRESPFVLLVSIPKRSAGREKAEDEDAIFRKICNTGFTDFKEMLSWLKA